MNLSMASMSPAAMAVVVGDAVGVIVMVHDIRPLLSGYYTPFSATPLALRGAEWKNKWFDNHTFY